jgi:hypothetical protein
MTFEERSTRFQNDIGTAQKKYQIEVYATQVLMKNGEITNLVKLRDVAPVPPTGGMVDVTKKYENKPKKGNPLNKKAQKDAN